MQAKHLVMSLCMLICAGSVWASAPTDIMKASERGETAFILVTDSERIGIDDARQIINQAISLIGSATSVELDKSDGNNAELVGKYRLAAAPVPLILVAAPNGVIAGGIVASQATPEKLVQLVPSPKKAEVLQHLQSGQAMLLTCLRPEMAGSSSLIESCDAVSAKLDGGCVTVEINMADPAELKFLQQLQVDPAASEPVTIVVNSRGQLTGTFFGVPAVGTLVEAATKRASGCCPSTIQKGASSCGPRG